MTATDELRRLLDERGVEWGDSSDENVLHTTWNGMNCWFNEFSDGWTAWGMAMGGTPEQAAKRRSEWYVTLAPGPEGLWIPERVTPKLKREPALKGRVKYLGQTIGGPQKAEMDYGTNMRRYYVRENTGRALEQAAQNGKLRAKVRIWHGEAVIQSVQIVPKSNEEKK